MAWQLTPGTDLILNVHLQAERKSGGGAALSRSVFHRQASGETPMLVQLEHDSALDIPAGAPGFIVTDTLKLPADVEILRIYPHAHYIAKGYSGVATLPDGSRRWLIHIPDWDIQWQAVYRYRKPVFLPAGTVVTMRYTYDNSTKPSNT